MALEICIFFTWASLETGVEVETKKVSAVAKRPASKPQMLDFFFSPYVILKSATETVRKQEGRGEKRAWRR